MQHYVVKSCIKQIEQHFYYMQDREVLMLRLTVSTEEYLMIGEDIKIVFLGGSKNHVRIMVDVPKEMDVVRSSVLENRMADQQSEAALPKYYAEPELDKKFQKKKKSRVVITKGSIEA